MKINAYVEFSRNEFELIAEAISFKLKTDEVQKDGMLINKYMNIYDKANCIAMLEKTKMMDEFLYKDNIEDDDNDEGEII